MGKVSTGQPKKRWAILDYILMGGAFVAAILMMVSAFVPAINEDLQYLNDEFTKVNNALQSLAPSSFVIYVGFYSLISVGSTLSLAAGTLALVGLAILVGFAIAGAIKGKRYRIPKLWTILVSITTLLFAFGGFIMTTIAYVGIGGTLSTMSDDAIMPIIINLYKELSDIAFSSVLSAIGIGLPAIAAAGGFTVAFAFFGQNKQRFLAENNR